MLVIYSHQDHLLNGKEVVLFNQFQTKYHKGKRVVLYIRKTKSAFHILTLDSTRLTNE